MRQPYRPARFRRPSGSAGRADAAADHVAEPASNSDELEIDDLFGALERASDDIIAVELETEPAGQESAQHADVAPVDMRMPADLVTSDLRHTFGLSQPPVTDIILRPYQEDAIRSWTRHDGRGVIVLPTGAGKTVVALGVAAQLGLRTLVVVPTIELLQQWRQALADRLGYPLEAVGIVGGGKRTVRDVTVITYDSAAMPHRRLDGFGLLVVDEVHHLPARAYRSIAGKVNAPFRLGLSATPERSDDGHIALDHLIGPIVFRRTPGRAGPRPAHRRVRREAPVRRPDRRRATALRPAHGRVPVLPGVTAGQPGPSGRDLRRADPPLRHRSRRPVGATGPPPGANDRPQRRGKDRQGRGAAAPSTATTR